MTQRNTVVEKPAPLSKPRLHALLMCGWARAILRGGKGGFADALELTVAAIDKQLAGSMPGFETIDRALDLHPDILDDWLKAKGKRIVDAEAVCDVDDLSLLLARVLVMIREAEHPDGPGGPAIVPQEYLAGETLMRALHIASARWIERCDQIRRPRAA